MTEHTEGCSVCEQIRLTRPSGITISWDGTIQEHHARIRVLEAALRAVDEWETKLEGTGYAIPDNLLKQVREALREK